MKIIPLHNPKGLLKDCFGVSLPDAAVCPLDFIRANSTLSFNAYFIMPNELAKTARELIARHFLELGVDAIECNDGKLYTYGTRIPSPGVSAKSVIIDSDASLNEVFSTRPSERIIGVVSVSRWKERTVGDMDSLRSLSDFLYHIPWKNETGITGGHLNGSMSFLDSAFRGIFAD